MSVRVPCVIMRGGTSKGIFFHAKDLPVDAATRDAVILGAFGSPDPRQVDGLGGADPLTSKLAIVTPSQRHDSDIDYTFGQVAIDQASINYAINCGNLAAGAAAFAVDEGLVEVREPVTAVRIFNTNTGAQILATVPVSGGRSLRTGDCAIDGVPGTGAPIDLTFLQTAGRLTGLLLPTGASVNRVRLPGGPEIEVSIVDTGNLYVFVRATDLHLRGDELPVQIEQDAGLMATLRALLETCTALTNDALRPGTPLAIHKLAIVAPWMDASSPADFAARIVSSNGKAHRAFAVTGGICAASCAFVEGSVVNQVLRQPPGTPTVIAHPQGRMAITIECEHRDGVTRPLQATIRRTARRIMEGWVSIDRPLAIA